MVYNHQNLSTAVVWKIIVYFPYSTCRRLLLQFLLFFNAPLFISQSSALLQMVETVPFLSASPEDIMACVCVRCVMQYVRAANGCCRAEHQETSGLMKTWREISVCSLQYTEKQTEGPLWEVHLFVHVHDTDTTTERTDESEEENIQFYHFLYLFFLNLGGYSSN